MQISVVIPTCNRKKRLIALLGHLSNSIYPIREVIIVDSGEEPLSADECAHFGNFQLHYLKSPKSVCIQRNLGIRKAISPWIFLCDDDMEPPPDYLQKLVSHINEFPDAGAVSGVWLQLEKNEWKATYPENSSIGLLWKYIFQLGIWGQIACSSNNTVIKHIKKYYSVKGNHISRAGWPVITDFSGHYFITPVYSLGASLVKRDWLLHSPFDEVLDPHGIGDNYGVILDFPSPSVHVLNDTFVYHHHEPANRLQKPLQYYRRVLALDYFLRTRTRLIKMKRIWLAWSLTGNFIRFVFSGEPLMIRSAFKSLWMILIGRNPYYRASKNKKKIVEPML